MYETGIIFIPVACKGITLNKRYEGKLSEFTLFLLDYSDNQTNYLTTEKPNTLHETQSFFRI